MNKFVKIQLFKAFDKVSFYTLWVEGRPQSEANAFFNCYEKDTHVAQDLELLVSWIIEIGQKRGAKARYFRFENDAGALPPPYRIMSELGDGYCRLRIYCIRISDQIVILANGGLKTGRSVQDSPDLLDKFRFANKMAAQLFRLMGSGELTTDGKIIVDVEDIELID